MTGREHAVYASVLLDAVQTIKEQLEDSTPERILELASTGQIAQINESVEYSVRLATAHALTALALSHTEYGIEELEVPE